MYLGLIDLYIYYLLVLQTFFLPSLHTVEANIDVTPKKTRSPHPWMRQPATAREDTAVPGPTWTPPPSSVDWVNIFLNACQIFLQTTHL